MALLSLDLVWVNRTLPADEAALYATAFSTLLILVGGSTGMLGGEADANFYKRIFLITLSVCYVVGALSLLQMPALRERWMGAGRWLSGKLGVTH